MSSSVKVAVRVRPFNERERGSKPCIVMVSVNYLSLIYFSDLNVLIINLRHRMDQQQSWLTLTLAMSALSPSITRSGLTMASRLMTMAFSCQLAQSTPIKTWSMRPSASKSSTMPGRATTAVCSLMGKLAQANPTQW